MSRKTVVFITAALAAAALPAITEERLYEEYITPCEVGESSDYYSDDQELCLNGIMSQTNDNEIKDSGDSLSPDIGTGWSPINIVTSTVLPLIAPPLLFSSNHWDESIEFILNNTGSYASFSPSDEVEPLILFGGPLAGYYKFHNIHFHCDLRSDCQGSEHAINGVRFAMEVHVVYYSVKYTSFEHARGQQDGIAVCGFLIEMKHGSFFNHGFELIAHSVTHVKEAGTSTRVSFNPLLILSPVANTNRYFHYQGSLTGHLRDPVSWIVFCGMLQINPYQITPFRQLSDFSGNLLDNVDDLQDLKNRSVFIVDKRQKGF